MFIGASIIIMGTLIQAPSTNIGMFIGGRFVLGFGVATCATAGMFGSQSPIPNLLTLI